MIIKAPSHPLYRGKRTFKKVYPKFPDPSKRSEPVSPDFEEKLRTLNFSTARKPDPSTDAPFGKTYNTKGTRYDKIQQAARVTANMIKAAEFMGGTL